MNSLQIENTRVLAVSKLQSEEKIIELYNKGQRIFGENYVQEALTKIEDLKHLQIEWHLIGHLQKKKVKSIIGKFACIHSIDSLELLQRIGKLCNEQGLTQDVLLQVNVAGEQSKEGFSPEELLHQWQEIQLISGIRICGLMTMPPLAENPEYTRPHFRGLLDLRNKLQKITDILKHPLTELSMGTSHDYKVAIEEGATIVRLGTILFGDRPLKEVKFL